MSSRTLPPTFLFLLYSVFKERTSQTRCHGPCRFWLWPGRVSLTRLSMIFTKRWGEVFARQRRAALVGEAYIGGVGSECQQGFGTFLNFLRRSARIPCSPCVTPCSGPVFPDCRVILEPKSLHKSDVIYRDGTASPAQGDLPSLYIGARGRAFVDFAALGRQLS